MATIEEISVFDIPGSAVEEINVTDIPEKETLGSALWRHAQSGTFGLAGNVGSALRWGGEAIGGTEFYDPLLTQMQEASDSGKPEDDPIANIGKIASSYWSERAREVRPEYEGTFWQNPSWRRAAGLVTEAIPSLGTAVLATVASGGSTIVGAGVLSALEGSGQFEEAREAGKGVEEASLYGAASTVATFMLEKFGLDSIVKGGGSGLLKRLIRLPVAGTAEGTTESLQTITQNMIAKYGYEPTRQAWDGVVESFIGGFGAGGGMSAITNIDEGSIDFDEADTRDLIEAASQVVESEVSNLTPELPEAQIIEEVGVEEIPEAEIVEIPEEEGGFSADPATFVAEEYLPVETENRGIFHVTTAKTAVATEGFKSRRELGGKVGLGGGVANRNAGMVSTTTDAGHAALIEERMRLAVEAASGLRTTTEIADYFANEYRMDEPTEMAGVLNAPDDVVGDWEELDAWIAENYDPYELVQVLDDAALDLYDDPEFTVRVGFTASKENMASIDVDEIETLTLSARVGAESRVGDDQTELAFNPEDLRVITEPTEAVEDVLPEADIVEEIPVEEIPETEIIPWDVINEADIALEGKAAHLVDTFVGHPAEGAEGVGFALLDVLDSAIADNTQEAQELEKEFAPVREAIRKKVGDTITLYRWQRPVKGVESGTRSVLSWSSSPEFPNFLLQDSLNYDPLRYFASVYHPEFGSVSGGTTSGATPQEAREKAQNLIDQYAENPEESPLGEGGDLIDYDKTTGKITPIEVDASTFSVEVDKEPVGTPPEEAGRIISEEVPLDNVIWVTDRANQKEFIVKTEGIEDVLPEAAVVDDRDLVAEPAVEPEPAVVDVEVDGKRLWEMSRSEFDDAIVEESVAISKSQGHKRTDPILDRINKTLAKRFNINPDNITHEDIKRMVAFYQEKYNMETPISLVGTGEAFPIDAIGSVRFEFDEGSGVIIAAHIDVNQILERSPHPLATIRHEIEHIIDHAVDGVSFEATTDYVKGDLADRSGTIAEKLRRRTKGHHARVENFELDYLRRSMVRDAMDAGENVPASVLQDVGLAVEPTLQDPVTTPYGEFKPANADHARNRIDVLGNDGTNLVNELEELKNNDVASSRGAQFVEFVKKVGGWLSPHLDKDGNRTNNKAKQVGNRGEYDYWRGLKESRLEKSFKLSRFIHRGSVPIDVWFNQHQDRLSGMGINDLADLHDLIDSYSRSYEGTQLVEGRKKEINKDLLAIQKEMDSNEQFIMKEEGTDFDPAEFLDDPLPEAERALAEEVDEVVGETPAPAGLAIRRAGTLPGQVQIPEEAMAAPPEIEQRMQNAHGKGKQSWMGRAKEYLLSVWRSSTRNFELLESGARYAQVRQLLSRLPKQKAIATQRTLESINGIVAKLNRSQFRLFERKVLYDDLLWEAEQGHDLPFGFTPEILQQEHSKVSALVASDPATQEAIEKRRDYMNSLRTTYQNVMKSIGLDPQFDNPNYFRHQVLTYAEMKNAMVTEKGIQKPARRGFLKKRFGSELDINTNYMEAEGEVIAQMLRDMEVARIISYVRSAFDIMPQVRQDMKDYSQQTGIPVKDLKMRDFLPEGYDTWQPEKGRMFYLADSIPARIADDLMTNKLESYNLTAEEISQVLAVGGRKMEFVIPTELARTLDKPFPDKLDSKFVDAFSRKPIKYWKIWSLTSPWRIIKYNLRNLSGDLEAIFLGNARAFLKVPQAVRELNHIYRGNGAMTDTLRSWHRRGGFETNLQVQELGDASKLKAFENIAPLNEKTKADIVAGVIKAPWHGYWNRARILTDFRESVLRYAAYLDYIEQIERNGRPPNYGASIPSEVDAIEGTHDKAFKLSNDLLGAYDEVTVTGNALREHLIPFWSFQEINMKRYWRLFKNAANDATTAETIGRRVAVGAVGTTTLSAKMAIRLGKFALMVSAMETAVQLWNTLFFPDEEDDLPETVAGGSHIVLGRMPNGDPIYFSRVGLLQDMLDWFGLEDYRLTVNDLMTGKTTWQEVVKEMALSPVDKVFQGSRPFVKLMAEMASGRSFFPSVFEPRTIRDKGYHLAKSLALDKEYVALMRLPSSGYLSKMSNMFVYTVNPDQSAYANILDKKNKYSKKVLKKGGEGSGVSDKGNALYNYRLAIKLGDKDAEQRFLKEYLRLSAERAYLSGRVFTEKQAIKLMADSIRRAEPLYGMNDFEKIQFIAQLTDKEKADFSKAYHFWFEVLGGKEVGLK